MQEHRAAEHQRSRRHEASHRMQPTPRGPKIHEKPAEKDVQCDQPIRRRPQRQHEVQPIGWIKQSRLETAQERLSRVNVRIPKGQIALP